MLQKQLVRRLDLMTLQLFVSVHEEGTLTRGAEREMIALSAASKRMNDMEQALGIEVFERTAKGMGLTAAGETLLYYAKRILADVEKTQHRCRRASSWDPRVRPYAGQYLCDH